MSDRVEEIRNTLARIEANIERTEMRKAWRNVDENTVEEYIEFWVRTERGGEQSDN